MGWHYILNIQCQVLPEFMDFIRTEYLRNYEQITAHAAATLPKSYRKILGMWSALNINNFYEYSLTDDGKFTLEIQKSVSSHEGSLWDDYVLFVKDIIVPLTTDIMFCQIRSDDYGDRVQRFTDLELRGGNMSIRNNIKQIEHVWEDNEIVETRIIYKHSIKNKYELDLDRCYKYSL